MVKTGPASPDGEAARGACMLDFVRQLWEADSLSPHGICLLWQPALIWSHVTADALIGLSYYSIPVALGALVWKRRDIAFGWMFWCFAAFIMACGTTHFLHIWTLWVPSYGAEALVKLATAAVSVVTAVALWPLLPKVLALPSPEQLRRANEELSARIAERDQAIAALREETAERIKAEEMLRQSQKMEALGQLTGGVAHDFNNLLGIIVGNLERVELKLPPDSPLMAPVRDAMTGAERAAAITQKLLSFARKQPLLPEQLDLARLIQDLAELLRGTLGGNVHIETSLAPDLWPVRADPNQLENALLNLAVNARDAMPDGGTLAIRTANLPAAERGGEGAADYVAIEVSDTGEGMTPEVAERAFEPFFTTKPIGQGTGLGLSQVHGFARQSGGVALIETALGRGTTVRLLLPRDRDGAPDAAPRRQGELAA
jgi:signal transduction histidine kinase